MFNYKYLYLFMEPSSLLAETQPALSSQTIDSHCGFILNSVYLGAYSTNIAGASLMNFISKCDFTLLVCKQVPKVIVIHLPKLFKFSSSVVRASSSNSACVGIFSSTFFTFFFCSSDRILILCWVSSDFTAVLCRIDFLSATMFSLNIMVLVRFNLKLLI